ncbi:hypothetical protein ES288_D04G165400v1 [Gossypium darwinii]|uniref:Ferritin n=1 Tax=Gossypium darwinii TaxID=34276 RepID=A0A5D2D0W6_GOSDA|nr:hypothetical protein ES288_D04G165400v1 [Gossypium darwinii]
MFLSSVSCSRPLWMFPALSSAPSFFPPRKHHGRASGISASLETENLALTGVVFQPFEEFKKEDFDILVTPQVSLARQKYTDDCEAAINEQINVEYSVSYVYHSLYAYFDRDNIALKEPSKKTHTHTHKKNSPNNIRGGRVKLHPILMPLSEFEHAEKGDALYAVELALSLEKLINEKLPSLHNVAEQNNDPQVADFIESEFLSEQVSTSLSTLLLVSKRVLSNNQKQYFWRTLEGLILVEAIKKISEYVAQLRLVGKGHGVWHFDQMLLHEGGAA